MHRKKIVFFSAILLLLVGFYYIFEIRYTGIQEEKAASSKKVLNIKDLDLERLFIKNPKETLVLEKSDKVWFLKEPIKVQADTWAVDQIINTLMSATLEREITPLPEDLADFGLDNPEIEVALSGKGLSKPHKILIGTENPTRNLRYVQVDQEARVLLITHSFRDALDKNADDLRDKHIFRFKQDDVFKLEWRAEEKTFVAEKRENKWVLTEPADKSITESQITSLILRLQGLKFKKIYEKIKHPLSYYSLDKPYGMIRVLNREKQTLGNLSFGMKKEPTASYYAKAEGTNTVYELSYDFVKDFPEADEEGKE